MKYIINGGFPELRSTRGGRSSPDSHGAHGHWALNARNALDSGRTGERGGGQHPARSRCTGRPRQAVLIHGALVGADGLPIGIQLAAPLGLEMRLLRLSAQLEQARPWAERRPGRYTVMPSGRSST